MGKNTKNVNRDCCNQGWGATFMRVMLGNPPREVKPSRNLDFRRLVREIALFSAFSLEGKREIVATWPSP